MRQRNAGMITGLLVTGAILLCAGLVYAEVLTWTNPTTGTDNAGQVTTLSAADQAALTNYLRYRPIGGAGTYFGETRGGKTSWTGALPIAEGAAADYSVSAALKGADGIERDSWSKGEAGHSIVRYTRPFPPGPTPAAATELKITNKSTSAQYN